MTQIKILTVSDRVEPDLQKNPPADQFADTDLILACGDLPPEYLIQLTSTLNSPLFYVKGNHDIRYKQKPLAGCIDIHAKIVNHLGVKIMGLGGSRWYNGGPNQYTERQMKGTIQKLRMRLWRNKGVDIVISHAPPRHVHDAEDRCHRGFKSFHPLISRHAPEYFIHGHIHTHFEDPTQRISTLDRTKVINSYGYFLFEIDSDRRTPKG